MVTALVLDQQYVEAGLKYYVQHWALAFEHQECFDLAVEEWLEQVELEIHSLVGAENITIIYFHNTTSLYTQEK